MTAESSSKRPESPDAASPDPRLIVMVSSTVYGNEELLELIYTLLVSFGYEVWMSHKGTMPVLPDRSNFQNCLDAVDKCDLFLGIITPSYGSGKDKDGRSITHEELLKAIKLDKPRWFLAHDHVVFARALLRNLGYRTAKQRSELKFKASDLLQDLRVIDMYEAAVRHDIQLQDRKGNWVQTFVSTEDGALFASAQFYRYQEVKSFLEGNFGDRTVIEKATRKGTPS